MRKNEPIERSHKPRPDREDTRLIAAHVKTSAVRALKHMAAERLVTTDILIHEGLALVFKRYGHEIPEEILAKLKSHGIDPDEVPSRPVEPKRGILVPRSHR